MKPIETLGPLDIQRPQKEKAPHYLHLTLRGDDRWIERTLLIAIKTNTHAPKRFLVHEFPLWTKKSVATIRQLDGRQRKLVLRLADPASPAKVHDLSTTPWHEWRVRMFSIFTDCPAGAGILACHGRMSVAMHEGN
jgi:hypothetical protein